MSKCSEKSCLSGLPAKWEPVILLWAEGYPKATHQPASVTIGLHVCDSCKALSKPWHYLDQDLRNKLKLNFYERGKAQPDFGKAEITFTLADTFKNDGLFI